MFLKSNKLCLVFSVFVSSFLGAFAQNMGEQQIQVAGISVEGNKYSDAETIIALSALRPGDKLVMPADDRLQGAVKNIWKRKQFSDVQIVIERMTPAGAFLKIHVEEYPRLNKILVEDNEEIAEKDIALAAGKIRGDIVTPYDVYLVKKSVKNLYKKEGLAFADIKPRLEKADSSDYVNMIINVTEGAEFHVDKIEFAGNVKLDPDDLKGSFKDTKTKSWWQFWRSSVFNEDEYEKDKALLKTYMKSQGFMESDIAKDTLIFNADNETVTIRMDIIEGDRFYVRNINFDGNTVYLDEQLKKRLDFMPGEVYDQEKFNKNLFGNEDQSDALSLYMDNGYLDARFEPKEKKITSDSIDIDISVFENQRYKIARIDIVGNTKTKDKVIRRELYTRPGDYFDRSAIIRSIRALGVLNYFNQESLKPDVQPSTTDKNTVNITYKVEERSTDQINASIGFAGYLGLTASVGLTFNNFSLFEPLMGGSGQVMNFNFEKGATTRLQRINLGFSEPWLMDMPTTVGFNIFDQKIDYTYKLHISGASLNFGRRFRWPDDYFRGDWSFSYQYNDISDDYVSSYYRAGKNHEFTLAQTISRVSLNNLFFPSVGSRFSLATEFAMGGLGIGSTDYFKNELTFDTYTPILTINGVDRAVIYLGAKTGYITGIKSDTSFNPIKLYYMGGNGLSGYGTVPLRGYEDRMIGSDDGQQVMSKYTAELRFALSLDPMPIFVYGFAEAGNVWSKLSTTNPFELKRSAGVGIQMLLNPIGIIGFSYGYGFDNEYGSAKPSGWRFLFHLGGQ